MTCDEDGRTGSRAPAGEVVAASAARLRGRGRRPGGPRRARERKEDEFGTDGTRTTAAAERFTSAAVGAAARLAGRRRVRGRWVLVWAARARSEDERSTGKHLPAAESFGRPTVAGGRN
jgi:hypothetical protein